MEEINQKLEEIEKKIKFMEWWIIVLTIILMIITLFIIGEPWEIF